MLNFTTPTVEDAQWAVPLISCSDALGCDASFANTYLWKEYYNTKICRFKDFLLKSFVTSAAPVYSFPIGCGDVKQALDAVIDDAAEKNIPLLIAPISEDKKLYLENAYPNLFQFTESRESADYIYLSENLASLPGKKYQKKRNHISRFTRLYPEYSFTQITKDNAADALQVSRDWCRLHGQCGAENGLDAEFCAIKSAFQSFDELKLFGGILYIADKPAAMTVASEISPRICDVHFEKALDFDGAYTMINREFSKTLTGYKYINREEDLGLDGLRKAKLSYHPEILLTKYTAKAVK